MHACDWSLIVPMDTIPEFSSLIILPLFMIATLLAALVHRRRKAGKAHKLTITGIFR